MTPSYIAFYGLLMPGHGPYETFGLGRSLEPLGSCRIPGRLYDLGSHPDLLRGGGEVHGTLYRIIRPSVLRVLDDFEEYDPANPKGSIYLRQALRLVEPDLTAWVYVYNRKPPVGRRVPSGRWQISGSPARASRSPRAEPW